MSAGGGGREDAARRLDISEMLLCARDLIGCKRFAERAAEADPFVGGGVADQVMAVSGVILSSQVCVNNHVDWYAVLQHDSSSPLDRQPSAVLRQYSRLALLLRPDRNHLDGASFASKLVSDAWAVLLDPSKKPFFDSELDIAVEAAAATASAAPPTPPPPARPSSTIWAACPSCFHLHQYGSEYKGKNLQCPNCRRTFCATPLLMGIRSPRLRPAGIWRRMETVPSNLPGHSTRSTSNLRKKGAATTPVKATPLASGRKPWQRRESGKAKTVSLSEVGTRSSERLRGARSAAIDINTET